MNRHLKNVLIRAKKSEFYKTHLPEKNTFWKDIPLTTKEDLRQAYPFGFLAVPRHRLSTYHESSGTTGQAIASFFTDEDWIDIQRRFLRNRVKLGEHDTVMVKTPYAMTTTAHQMHGAARLVGATVVPADNRSSNMPYTRVLRLLRDLAVTVAWCLPTEALLWAYLARRKGMNPMQDFPQLRALLVAGEVLSPAKKAMLSRVWGGKLIAEDYGSTETGSLAGECEHGHLHFWSDRVLLELSAAETLVVTPLYREAMPLIRYDLEDQVRFLSAPCPCGSPLPRIEVLGRKNSRTREIEQAIYSVDVVEPIWFWRARPSGSVLEVEIHTEAPQPRLVANAVAANLYRQLGIEAVVSTVDCEEFVAPEWLQEEQVMQKPRYIFAANENWQNSLSYARGE